MQQVFLVIEYVCCVNMHGLMYSKNTPVFFLSQVQRNHFK